MADLTYDAKLKCGYLTVHPLPEGEHVHRSVDVTGGVVVDLDADGRLLGVETLGGPVDMRALGEVLRWVRVADRG